MGERKGISTRQERKIWAPEERDLVYLGAEGRVIYYSDGIRDHLIFTDFLPGKEWERLKRSIRSLRRESLQGRYKVKATDEAKKAEIIHSPEKGFEEIWKDVTDFLTQKPGLVELGKVREIKDFILQDLKVED